jgi:molybdopterin molybdotransferase
MYSVEQATEQILTAFARLKPETVLLHEASGRTLAADVTATLDLPPFPNSSMDGFALRADDLRGDLPITLHIIEDIPAGVTPTKTVESGQAARIMTGAMLPLGADAVIPFEQTNLQRMEQALPETIQVMKAVKPGDYIRPVGEDLRTGEVILHAGRVLRPADVGMLAALGIAQLNVIRRPRVAILSSGDELIPYDAPAEALTTGKIRNSNAVMLAAQVRELGADVIDLGIARDTEADVEAKLRAAVDAHADLILSSAGVSVGAFDVMRTVVERLGALDFWKVNLRPGKPLAFGNVCGVPYLGLPGNPVSAFVTFDLFARSAILKLSGRDPMVQYRQVEAITAEPIPSDGRRSYVRVQLEQRNGLWVARLTGTQSSGALSSLVKADGLLIIPEGTTEVPAGSRLQVRVL